MHRSCIAARLLLGLALCALPRGRHGWDPPAPRFAVSLDLPAAERWASVMRAFDPKLVRRGVSRMIVHYAPAWAMPLLDELAESLLLPRLPYPYAEEVRGLAAMMGLRPGELLLVNLAYEYSALCTSVLVANSGGRVLHGRNLDCPFTEFLSNVTIDVDFTRGGQVAYTGTTFVGYVGLWTAQRPGRFTLSANQRGGTQWWQSAMEALMGHGRVGSWLIRNVILGITTCEFYQTLRGRAAERQRRPEADDHRASKTVASATSFQEAVHLLSRAPLITSVYYVVGGAQPLEAAVISRSVESTVDVWRLKPGQWFMVQTNSDHWTLPSTHDDRRIAAEKALNATGQSNINPHTLFKALSVYPTMNRLTVYTNVMSAAEPGVYRSTLRVHHP